MSSSSWGCELKYLYNKISTLNECHPLREDVSWNILYFSMFVISSSSSSSWGCELKYPSSFILAFRNVILFVRMWVEMFSFRLYCLMDYVILFVRMWVEMLHTEYISCLQTSSSSWGCELKYSTSVIFARQLWSSSSWGCELKCLACSTVSPYHCHPLREDVSWNKFELSNNGDHSMSSSSWGCELK